MSLLHDLSAATSDVIRRRAVAGLSSDGTIGVGPTPVVHTSETIHYLPGTIDISTLRAIQRARRGSSDRQVIHRAMVRGHWRRAGADWKDPRVRWIKPYWRGPSAAAVIEKQYRLLQ